MLGIINRLIKRNYLLLNRDTSLSQRNLLWSWILEMFCDRMFHWHILLSSNLFCAVVWPWTCQWISGSSFYVNECTNSVPKFKSLHFTERGGNFLEVSLCVVFLLKIFFSFFRKNIKVLLEKPSRYAECQLGRLHVFIGPLKQRVIDSTSTYGVFVVRDLGLDWNWR